MPAADFAIFAARAQEMAARLRQRERLVVLNLVQEVGVEPSRVVIHLNASELAVSLRMPRETEAPTSLMLISHGQLKRSGRVMRLVDDSGAVPGGEPSAALIRLIFQAHHFWAELRRGEIDITRLGELENVHPSYLTRIVRLAFLSPAGTDAILAGQHRPNVNAETMNQPAMVDASWKDQATRLLPAR